MPTDIPLNYFLFLRFSKTPDTIFSLFLPRNHLSRPQIVQILLNEITYHPKLPQNRSISLGWKFPCQGFIFNPLSDKLIYRYFNILKCIGLPLQNFLAHLASRAAQTIRWWPIFFILYWNLHCIDMLKLCIFFCLF